MWKGCFISESLKDPTILNTYETYKFYITEENLTIDDQGTVGRWHMYWIITKSDDFEIFQKNMKYGWYSHFWNETTIVAIFEGKTFTFDRYDKSTRDEAITYGKSQGIIDEQLDFICED